MAIGRWDPILGQDFRFRSGDGRRNLRSDHGIFDASLRSIAAQAGDFESNHNFKPALIAVEDGCLAPAFLIEEHENGLSAVFMPSVPTPMAGGIFIMPSERVKLVDVSVATMMKCISKWGTGSGEIISALPPESLPQSS